MQYACQVFSVIPVKTLRLHDRITTPYEIFTGQKPNINRFRVLFCPCIMKKYTATKKLANGKSISEDVKKKYAQRGFRGVFIGFDQKTNGYLAYVPVTRQIVTSKDIIFDESFASTLAEGDRPFKEAMAVRPFFDLPVPWEDITDHTGDITTMSPYRKAFDSVQSKSGQRLLNFIMNNWKQIDFSDAYDYVAMNSGEVSDASDLSVDNNISDSILQSDVEIAPDDTTQEENADENADANDDDAVVNEFVPSDVDDESDLEVEHEHDDPPVFSPRRSSRLRKPTQSQDFVYLTKEVEEETSWDQFGDPTSFVPEPRGIRSILRLKKTDPLAFKLWSRAIKAEVRCLINLNTFKIEDPKNNEPVIPTLEVMKVKFSSDGTWDKAKARIVCRGDLQRQHSTEDTWNALAAKRTLRMFLADAASHGAIVYQLDFVGAFLQATVKQVTYVKLSEFLSEIYPEYSAWFGRPLRLIKSMYGMSFCGKWWFLEMMEYITEELNFRQASCDQALFIKLEDDGSMTKFLVYVDDSVYFNTGNNEKYLKAFETNMQARFKVDFQGHAHWFLAMRIVRDKIGNYTLDQARYIKTVTDKFLSPPSDDEKPFLRPLPVDFIVTKKDCSKDGQEVAKLEEQFGFTYSSAIGSLIYILNTRPDAMFAIMKLAKFMKKPGRVHFEALIHLLWYLRDNRRFGLKYYRYIQDSPIYGLLSQHGISSTLNIFGMHDSSWQDCPDTGRSTGAFLNFFQGGVVDFNSFVPTPVAMSSAEAENNAGAAACMSVSHLRMMMNEINYEDPDLLTDPPISMYCDSQGAILAANNDKESTRMRHSKRRLLYMRQVRREKEMQFIHMDGKDMTADCGTKNLDSPDIMRHSNIMMAEVPE